MLYYFSILYIAPGSFNVSVITLFRDDGIPLVRALVKVATLVCYRRCTHVPHNNIIPTAFP